MSENVYSVGLFAIITHKIEDYEDFSEKLYDDGTFIKINYEGTLVYSVFKDPSEGYGIRFSKKIDKNCKKSFIDECEKYKINIDKNSIKEYSCLWYNGCDSDMDTLTLEKYKKIK